MWSLFSRDPTKDFGFEVGEAIGGLEDQSIWTLHAGKRKSNGDAVSIFAFDVSANSDAVHQVAQASVKRLKTLRHPNVLTFIDRVRVRVSDISLFNTVYDITNPQSLKDGIQGPCILDSNKKGLNFLVSTVNLIHNNVCMSSIFVDHAGEWKLGGVDYMYAASGEGSNLPPFKTLPILEKYDPPEKSAKNRSKKLTKWSSDMWGLGCLIWEVFNGPLPRTSSLKVLGKIPKNFVPHYCELVGANPASRPSPEAFISNCREDGCFMNNHFVDTNLFLEEIQIKDPKETTEFYTNLTNHIDSFPVDYSKHKILPQLLNAFQFGNAGSSVLPPLFKLGTLLESEEYQNRIVPCVIKLFSSTDRATRIHLLRQMPLFVEHLKPQVVNAQVFPNIANGFMDTNPSIREQSVKAMLLLAPKLNDNNLNNELMKHFARLQSRDDQGPIRTNTTVCLGKIACHLNASTRQKVVSSAFTRAMRDPFHAARTAGILAMANNIQFLNTKDCAFKALPSLCALTVDPNKDVRTHAFKTISQFLSKLEKASEDPEYASKIDADAAAISTSAGNSMVPSVAGWTGWMSTGVSSLTSRLYRKGQEIPNNTDNQLPSTSPDASQPKTEQDKICTAKSPTSHKAQEEDEDDKSDYGEESEGDGWKANSVEWDELEDFKSLITPMYGTKNKGGGKLITVSKLKAMEENMWSQLHDNKKQDDGESGDNDAEAEDNDWDNSGWDVDDFNTQQKPVLKANNAKSSMKLKLGVKKKSEWDDWGNDESSDISDKAMKPEKKDSDSSLTPASEYGWADSANNDFDSFFTDVVGKPASKGLSKSKQVDTKHKQKVGLQSSKPKQNTVKTSQTANDWQWGDDNDWGEEEPGISKAEVMKKQRDEKRRQRQEELEKRRAARTAGGGKLGTRKMD